MKGLFLDEFEYEQTTPDKTKIKRVFPLHAIHFVVSGYGYFNGRRLGSGEGFICLRDDLVDYYPDEKDPWAYYWLNVSGEGVRSESCLNHPSRYFRFEMTPLFEKALSMILSSEERFKTDTLFSQACMQLLLSVSVREPHVFEPIASPSYYVAETKRFIETNYHKHISMEAIAASLGISRAYLRNVFFEREGISPQDFLTKVRLNRAKDLLVRPDVTISEGAFSVGYRDVSQFSRMFRKSVGISPTEYKQAHQVNNGW